MAYVQHTAEDIERMLQTIGLAELDDLFRSIPEAIRFRGDLDIPDRLGESGIVREFQRLGARNRRLDDMPSFLGAGVYDRFVPAAVDYLSSRGEFNTAYTPYQPEVSQGNLQAMFEYQTMIARLTGMEISNASMYEAGTALAEAIMMAYTIHGKGKQVLVSDSVHPEYRAVLDSYFRNHPIDVELLSTDGDGRTAVPAASDPLTFAVVVQNPNFFGSIEDGDAIRNAVTALAPEKDGSRSPLLIVVADPISLGALRPPGEYGADIVVGDGQSLGNDPNLGGPTFGFFATRQSHVRKIPGRVVGETTDRDGRRGYVLTFQTREQHIRRERATSNICTNQGRGCLRGAMSLALLGEHGVRQAAEVSARTAHFAARCLLEIPGVERRFAAPFFQEFVLELPQSAESVYDRLLQRGVRGGLPLSRYFPERTNDMLFACTETTTVADVETLVHELGAILASSDEQPVADANRLEKLPR